ncbi:MAG: hypothetical protein ABW134_20840, partial [Candidatus Thiodiazotropha endolucinida]
MKVPGNNKDFMAWPPRFYLLSWWITGGVYLHREDNGTHLYGPDKLRDHVYGTIVLSLYQTTITERISILN